MNRPLPLRIIKVGGSLLDYRPLPERVRDWIGTNAPARNLIVAGGGPFAEAVRESQQRFGLDDAACHQLCMELLNVTARLVYEMLAPFVPCQWIGTVPQLRTFLTTVHDSRVAVIATGQLLAHSASGDGEPAVLQNWPAVPQNWDVTSDSLALLLAIQLQAEELVLLKSGACPGLDRDVWAASGYVDRHFPCLAGHFAGEIRAVDLRADV